MRFAFGAFRPETYGIVQESAALDAPSPLCQSKLKSHPPRCLTFNWGRGLG